MHNSIKFLNMQVHLLANLASWQTNHIHIHIEKNQEKKEEKDGNDDDEEKKENDRRSTY